MTARPVRMTGWTAQHVRHAAELFKQGSNPAARVYESIGSEFFLAVAPGWLNLGLWEGPGREDEAEEACQRLVRTLASALPAGGVALLNADDPRVLAMAGRTAARVVTFGRGPQAAVRAADVRLDDQGRPGFMLVTPAGSAPVRLRLFGEHNVTNALAAAALAGELGLALPEVADGLSAAVPRSRWRMEVTQRPDGVTVINDAYNASPEAMAAAIDTLAVMARGRRSFAVLGPMYELGGRSRAIHEAVGGRAARAGVAGLIVVGEDAAPILAGAKAVGSWHGELLWVPDVGSAVEAATARLTPGDVVLVKAAHSAGLERVALALTGEAAQ